MQRFGLSVVGSHEVGKEILKGNYEEAVGLILNPRPGGKYMHVILCRNINWDVDRQRAISEGPSTLGREQGRRCRLGTVSGQRSC